MGKKAKIARKISAATSKQDSESMVPKLKLVAYHRWQSASTTAHSIAAKWQHDYDITGDKVQAAQEKNIGRDLQVPLHAPSPTLCSIVRGADSINNPVKARGEA